MLSRIACLLLPDPPFPVRLADYLTCSIGWRQGKNHLWLPSTGARPRITSHTNTGWGTARHGMARHTTKPIARGADSGQRSSCVHFALLVCLFEDFGCVGVNHSAFFEVTQCLAFSVARWLSIHLLTLLEKLSLLHLGRWIKVFPEQLNDSILGPHSGRTHPKHLTQAQKASWLDARITSVGSFQGAGTQNSVNEAPIHPALSPHLWNS